MWDLTHVSPGGPGIRRVRCRTTFRYMAADGTPVRCPLTLARIRSLAVPPAWAGVWICPTGRGHIQAVGLDAKGRKKYRYHPAWRADRYGTKFAQLLAFGSALPRLRARVAADLGKPRLPRAKVLAAVARLLGHTHVRIGNPAYARCNQSFGLSTLQNRHVRVEGDRLPCSSTWTTSATPTPSGRRT